MAKPRKKWATKLANANAQMTRHTSETKAFEHVRKMAAHYAGTEIGRMNIEVFVDEGLGRGWELFECLKLSDVVPSDTN